MEVESKRFFAFKRDVLAESIKDDDLVVKYDRGEALLACFCTLRRTHRRCLEPRTANL